MSDPILDELMNEAVANVAPPTDQWPVHKNGAIAKTSYTHDAMVDIIIANPAINQNDIARHFGYTASWVSQVMASDAFQAKLLERTQDIVDPTLRATVEERIKSLVIRSIEILKEKLDRPSSAIPDNLVIRTLELSTRAMGYGARDTPPAAPAVNMHVHLETLGEGLTQLLRRKKGEVFEQENDDDKQIEA